MMEGCKIYIPLLQALHEIHRNVERGWVGGRGLNYNKLLQQGTLAMGGVAFFFLPWR